MILRRSLASLRTRLRGAAAERELDDELRDHLQMAIDENLDRGMNEQEATRAARRSLGVSTSIKEARRQADSLYWLDTLLQDLRYGVRILRRSPLFTVTVVLILGVGVGMTTAVFAIVDSLLLNAVPFADARRLVELNRFGPSGGGPSQPAALVEAWRNERALFDGVEAYERVERVFTGGSEPVILRGARVSPGLLSLLGVAPELGRAFARDESASPVAIISHATWRTRFGGDADIVGRPLRFSDGEFTIVGVMGASFRFPDADTVFWEPLAVGRRAASGNLRERRVSVVARLGQDVTFEQADARAAALAPLWDPESFPTGYTTRLRSLNGLSGLGIDGQFAHVQQGRGTLFLLLGLGVCMLLIACANAATLFLSQALSRAREFAIRAAAGASRARLCRQLLTESALISTLAGIAGLAFGGWLAGVAGTTAPVFGPGLLNPIDLDGRAAAWAAVAALLSGVAATLPLALRTVGRNLVRPMQGRGQASTGGHGRLRGGLLAVQSALAVVLLIGALLMGRALWSTFDIDIGWATEDVVALEPRLYGVRYEGTEARSRFLAQLADLTAAVPGVEFAAVAEHLPFLTVMLSFGRLDTDEASIPEAEITVNHVSSGYFAAAGIPILEGRGFDGATAEPNPALVSRDLAARLWPPGAAVGQRFRMPALAWLNYGASLTVVGVAGNVHSNPFRFAFSPDRTDPYEIYLPWDPAGGPWQQQPRFVLVRKAAANNIGLLKEQVWRLDPDLPVTVHAMDDVVATALAQPRFLTTLLGAFALLALLLAGAGLYTVVAYETSARTHEIGVRLALGATRGAVIRRVLGRSLLQSAAGAVLGLLGAIALTRLLPLPLYGAEPTHPATLTAATVFLLMAAAGGAWLPARRAAHSDPMAALRAE